MFYENNLQSGHNSGSVAIAMGQQTEGHSGYGVVAPRVIESLEEHPTILWPETIFKHEIVGGF